jgi:RNA 2',3'-cyclic 3'-phosphodiesterase
MAAKKRKKFIKERPPAPNPVTDQWRLFLAVRIPDDVVELIAEITQELDRAALPLRLVEPHLAHITLHFLGETAPERAELLKLALPTAVTSIRPFRLSTTHLGVFPNDRKPRVLWLGLAGDTDPLKRVHTALGKTLQAYEFETESRDFHPHITLARTREQATPSFPGDLAKIISSPAMRAALSRGPVQFDVQEVELIRSHLSKSGSRYETVGTYMLGGRHA